MKICRDGRIWGQNNSYHKPEYIKKLRESNLGPKSPHWKGGISYFKKIRKYKSHQEYLYSRENLEKLKKIGSRNQRGKNNPMYGKHHSQETRIKMSERKKLNYLGKNNPNWHGGMSFLPYSPEFNEQLKEEIRQRDNFKCQICFIHQTELRTRNNKPYDLIVHHIDLNKNNNDKRNLLSLCRECHLEIHYGQQLQARHSFSNKFMEVLVWSSLKR